MLQSRGWGTILLERKSSRNGSELEVRLRTLSRILTPEVEEDEKDGAAVLSTVTEELTPPLLFSSQKQMLGYLPGGWGVSEREDVTFSVGSFGHWDSLFLSH